jgi:hypothetical protein
MKCNHKELLEFCEETESEILLADGFEEAIIGISEHNPGREQVAIYDRDKCIEILAKDMTYEEAEECLYFNTIDAYVGDKTPIFI